ncbi:hypothetical protein ACWDU8_21640 [Streptomyces sp. NPDC003388]|nr:hypothetical protein [Streptomyces sp. 1-11]
MPTDPYAVLRALLRAEARRSAPARPEGTNPPPQRPVKEDGR